MIALIDCDAFFCNCERLFRADLLRRPVIVLSNNDGCAVSRTKEAKELGIEMGAPYFKIKELCDRHKVAVFSSNFPLYTNISARVMNTLKRFAPRMEIYSVDEGFLDLTGIASPESYCRHIKEVVEREVGVPISIGIAATKGLCKAACFLAKRDPHYQGVVALLEKKQMDQVLGQMPVEKIWGIAKGRGLRLRMVGIKTALDFRDFKNDRYIQKILTKVGRQIQEELRGQVCFPITNERSKKKEIMSSRTFGTSVFEKRVLLESLATHASEVASELRSQASVCQEVMIYIRSNPFKEEAQQYAMSASFRFETPTADTFKIIGAVFSCLENIYKPGIEYKKSGVRLVHLHDASEYALGLFDVPDRPQIMELMNVMDRINRREGPRTIHAMACGSDNREWKMNRNFKSPRFTTSWDELPVFG